MKREYWIDKGYIERDSYISYDCIETYDNYKQALQEYTFQKLNLNKDEYVEFWLVDWDNVNDEMIDYKVKFRFEKRRDK